MVSLGIPRAPVEDASLEGRFTGKSKTNVLLTYYLVRSRAVAERDQNRDTKFFREVNKKMGTWCKSDNLVTV